MTFTVSGTITRCAGQNHWQVPITIGGVEHTLHILLSEIQFDPLADPVETRDKILDRLRSAAREANAATFAQVRAALEGQTFKL